jgi:predicted AAA+ superfamily ATPase
MATSIGLLAQELSSGNPWWRGTQWVARDPDLSEVAQAPLRYESGCLDNLEPGNLYILRGPRRVGKTVAVKQTIGRLLDDGVRPARIVRVAVDGWDAKALRTLVSNSTLPVLREGETRFWFFDEVSAVSGDWAQQVKWLRDNDEQFRRDTVILTGSNARALTEAAGVLAGRRGRGRHLDRILLPMGFRTFATTILQGDVPPGGNIVAAALRSHEARSMYENAIPWLDGLTRAWEQYLLYGGFPRSVSALLDGHPVPESFVDDLFDVVSADVFKNSQLPAATEMALLERLWKSTASPANLTSIGEDVGISNQVVTRHVEYLRDAFLLWACPQRSDGRWLPKPKSQSKLYAVDPLVARLPHLRNTARPDLDPTVLTEMQIGMAVRRRVLADRSTAGNDDFLFYARTPARKEIDFVSDHLGGVAIEGKYTDRGSWRSEAATVNASEWDGILVTKNVLDLANAGTAWAVPAGILAYYLDV